MSNAHIKPEMPISELRIDDVLELYFLGKAETDRVKSEAAKLRASLADLFFAASEKTLGEKGAA